MKRFIFSSLIIAGLSTGALAQTAAPAAAPPAAPSAGAPLKGANSFTEAQAKERIEKAGFTSVSSLMKDADGIWRGKASKGGAMVDVALDYKGDVTSN